MRYIKLGIVDMQHGLPQSSEKQIDEVRACQI